MISFRMVERAEIPDVLWHKHQGGGVLPLKFVLERDAGNFFEHAAFQIFLRKLKPSCSHGKILISGGRLLWMLHVLRLLWVLRIVWVVHLATLTFTLRGKLVRLN